MSFWKTVGVIAATAVVTYKSVKTIEQVIEAGKAYASDLLSEKIEHLIFPEGRPEPVRTSASDSPHRTFRDYLNGTGR